MALFQPETRNLTARNRRLFALYEIAYTIVDFTAAALFIVGSVLFFTPNLVTPGTWCFLVGSLCFALKPTLRLVREFHFLAHGDLDDLVRNIRD